MSQVPPLPAPLLIQDEPLETSKPMLTPFSWKILLWHVTGWTVLRPRSLDEVVAPGTPNKILPGEWIFAGDQVTMRSLERPSSNTSGVLIRRGNLETGLRGAQYEDTGRRWSSWGKEQGPGQTLPHGRQGTQPADTLAPNGQPPELRANTFLLLKAPGCELC